MGARDPVSLVLFTGPTDEPLTVQEAKDWARITESEDDDLVQGLIRAARCHVEQLTGRALLTQTWDLYLDCFPWQIDVPRPPLQSVTSIKYIDTEGVLQTLASSEYTVDAKSEPGRIVPAYGKVWPSTRYEPNAVQVRFVAGYGLEALDIDARAPELRQAIGVLVGTMYEQRETRTPDELTEVPEAFYQLVNQDRVFWL
jgi:uncharacterized phiE125 gp8 family phage protein